MLVSGMAHRKRRTLGGGEGLSSEKEIEERDSFPRLNRARTLRCDDASHVWALPCFFVARGSREKGVASAMLKAGRYIAAFSWTGTFTLFEKAGFVTVGNLEGSKRRMRRQLKQ